MQWSEQTLPASIFKAYDIRGIVGKTLTEDVVYAIGRAIASEAIGRGCRKFVVARDGRLSGPGFVKALGQGMQDSGCDVIDLGRVPTPVLYFATYHLGTGSGVMVTGSHNPPDYNGFKMMLAGETLSGDRIQVLRQRILDDRLLVGSGGYSTVELGQAYIDRITSDVRLARPLRVIVDAGNGVAGELAPALLRALGCEVEELFCEIDGSFPNHHPDPSQTENLEDLIHAVKERKADLGLAFDGDGDRLGVVDGEGRIIWPDRQLMLYAADVAGRNPGAEIIYDVKCSRHLEKAISDAGGVPVMWKTGHSLIKARMQEGNVMLAGEMSGHVFFKERWYGFDDALYTAARLLEILSRDPRPVDDIFAAIPEDVSTPELRVDFAEDGAHFAFMERFRERADFPGGRVITIDGIRVEFADGWGLVRGSNTTPSLILRFEAENKESLARIQTLFREQMLAVDGALDLPF
ncbi:MAG: phosphomannomutase/phosphoglucomutase [Gammaproteobacteria bacterium]|nr:phosphomannomutase/phosphoglucomutase [Gammaproteobacteria bacterium]